MNTRSLRFQLIVWYAGLLTGVFVLFGVFMYTDLKQYLERDLEDSQLHRARVIADTLVDRVAQTGERYVIDEINTRYAPALNDRFVRITRADGSVLYLSSSPKDGSFDATQVLAVKLPVRRELMRKVSTADGKPLLIVTIPCQAGGQAYAVEVGASLGPIRTVLDLLLLSLVLGLPAVVVVAVAGGYRLVGRALAPVEKMARSAEQITLHNLSDRLPIAATGDELERLSRSLNHMITRLDESFQQTRRFMADASHELRTPLTIMRGELENAVQQPHLPADLREGIGSVLEEVERLAKIVESLFALSRLDAGEAQTEWVRFDLAKLATATAEQMCLLAEDKGISITCCAPHPVPVEGDRSRLKQVVVNLLDNAIKYTQRGGGVKLTVAAQPRSAVLEVADNGIGIPPEALPHVFERFFRVDKARSRDQGGAGIGLSIVKSICTAHGGRVEVTSQPGQGSRFRVELPLATASIELSKQHHGH
ncbi:MAG: HAMP domain-containing protein [Verrucomicrobia bacterium]|nr:HAMP domain-containing protein [Verrucomicrobiota bacterium]